MKVRSKRSTSAVLVAVLALVFGVAGTAMAGGTAYKLTKGQVRLIAAKVVKNKAPTLEVAKANTADSANHADSADNADNATNLASLPASRYLNTAYRYRISTAGAPTNLKTFTASGLPNGKYAFNYNVIANTDVANAGISCYVKSSAGSTVFEGIGFGSWGSGNFTAVSGGGSVDVTAGPPVLICYALAPANTIDVYASAAYTSTISFVKLDSLSTTTASGSKGTGSKGTGARPGN